MKGNRKGLTLVELLVGMALLGIILSALTSFFVQSSKTSVQSSVRAELQQETLNAQQLITGKLKEAFYIYPPGSSINKLTETALTRNPITSNNNWNITSTAANNHPMLAMILPPRNPGLTCAASTAATPDPDGCYRFVAYYPVKRSDWLSGTATDSFRNPGADPTNDSSTWVLAEYRRVMPPTFDPSSYPFATPPAVPTSATANLLSDYIAPTIASGATYTMFTYTTGGTPSAVTSVTINLATSRNSSGKTIRLPGTTGTYSISVTPTNLGKIASN